MLHAGDQIKFRQTDKTLGISNIDFGQITNIRDGSVTVKFENDRQFIIKILNEREFVKLYALGYETS